MSTTARKRRTLRELWLTALRFWPYLRGQRGLILGATAALFAEIVLRLGEPWPLKIIFDRLLSSSQTRGRWDRLLPTDMPPGTIIWMAAAAVVLLAALRAAAAYANSVGFALVGNRVLSAVRRDLFDHLQRLSLRYHTRARTGDLLTRLVGDVGRLQDVVVTAVAPLIVHSLTLLGMLALMFVMNWQLGMMAAAIFPLLYISSIRISRRIRDAARQQRQREGEVSAAASEGLSAIRTVQSLGIEEQQSRAFGRSNSASLRESVRSARLSAGLERSVDCLIGLTTAAILWRGAVLVLQEKITPGDLIVFLAYLKNAFKPMRDMAKYTGRVAKAIASGERVMEILDTVPEITDTPGCGAAPEAIEEIRFENVDFEYEPGSPVLTGFILAARMGEKVAIVGPSGAGKSTVASLLLRLYDPTNGQVLINGKDIRAFSICSLRQRVAAVLQESYLFGVSIRENITLANPHATERQVVAACEAAGAWEFIRPLPRGLETMVAERGESLSGGQRRRIALARAALRTSPILLLDEPTTGLDNKSKALVSAALSRLGEGRLTILIAHDLSTAADADQILYLERGRVVEQGTHESLMEQSGRYAAMFLLQAASRRERAAKGAPDALPR